MRSQELIHLHALLVEVRGYLEREERLPAGAFAAYDAQQTGPFHIHQSKEEHKQAISLLVEGIDRSIQSDPPREEASIQ
ncbi:UPF0058 family protein [Natronoarchaeum sp. GCM10025703]|uniref:UPF0058 family protein n=1 Tax=unclassified Natronoarchaeum TaxID=2620183 RepID=UPI00360D0D5E